MTGMDERLAKVAGVLREHGIYGFNGSQVACRCSSRKWRYVLDWHTHVTEALEPLLAEWQAEDEELALREAAGERDQILDILSTRTLQKWAAEDEARALRVQVWDEGFKHARVRRDGGGQTGRMSDNPYRERLEEPA